MIHPTPASSTHRRPTPVRAEALPPAPGVQGLQSHAASLQPARAAQDEEDRSNNAQNQSFAPLVPGQASLRSTASLSPADQAKVHASLTFRLSRMTQLPEEPAGPLFRLLPERPALGHPRLGLLFISRLDAPAGARVAARCQSHPVRVASPNAARRRPAACEPCTSCTSDSPPRSGWPWACCSSPT